MKKQTLFLLIAGGLVAAATASWVSFTEFGPVSLFYLNHANHLFAIIGFIFFFFQFVLSAKIQAIEKGFGLDRMLHLHRTFGRLALIFLTLHFLSLLVFELIQYGSFFLIIFRWVGIIALAALFITALVAFHYKTWKIPYETWKNIHRANYVIFPFALIHVFSNAIPGTFLYYLWILLTASFAAILIHKLVRFLHIRRQPYQVIEVNKEAEDIYSLYFQGPPPDYKPGQFLHVQLLRDGTPSASHPFTISSSPTREHLSITPKELGDFTQTIKETKPGDQAFIDAPYGIFSFLNYGGKDLVFIAGGIGITPFISMLRYVFDQKLDKNITLLWGNRSEENLCFTEELETMEQELEGLSLVYVMSGQDDWTGEKGRINGELIQKYIPDVTLPHFFVCGPPKMSNAVINDLKSLGVEKKQIHYELFEL